MTHEQLPEVTTVGFKVTSKRTTYTDHFTYKKRGRWDFIQRMCFKYLTKIRAFSTVHEDVYSTVSIKNADIVKMVQEQIRGLYVIDKQPDRIFIGRETMLDFVHHADFPLHCSFRAPLIRLNNDDVGRRWEIRGLPVIVLPTFVGVLVVPKE